MMRRKRYKGRTDGESKLARILRAKVVLLVLASIVLVAGLAYVFARQERARRVQVNGKTITVKAGGDVQTALDSARPGDTILLEAGATFRANLKLPNKPGNEFITIRSSASDAQLPAQGERIDPSRYATLLPKLVATTAGESAITATGGAHHYRFVCVEFGPTPKGMGNIILLGTTEETSLDQLPHHIEFDRVYVHGDPTEGQRRGIALNGRSIRIVNSYFSDIKRRGEESQAICGWGGDGPYEITNNYIEAAAEGILFGGATAAMAVTPSDIIVRGNHFNKPLQWRDEGWVVKNHFELKNAKRVKIENNLMTNNWAKGQVGTAVLFTVRDDSGAAATIEDVEFSNNIVRGAGGALNVYGAEGKGGHRLTIRNNVFDDINGGKWGGDGQFLTASQWDGLTIENNTIQTTGNITRASGGQVTNFIFRNNVIPQNEYGFHGDDRSPGQDSLDHYFPGSIVTNNAIVGGDSSSVNGRNMFPPSFKQLGFVNPEAADYRLKPDSPLKKRGLNGSDIGANLDPQTVGRVR